MLIVKTSKGTGYIPVKHITGIFPNGENHTIIHTLDGKERQIEGKAEDIVNIVGKRLLGWKP